MVLGAPDPSYRNGKLRAVFFFVLPPTQMGAKCPNKDYNPNDPQKGRFAEQGPALCGPHRAANAWWYGDGAGDKQKYTSLGYISKCTGSFSCPGPEYRRDGSIPSPRRKFCSDSNEYSSCSSGVRKLCVRNWQGTGPDDPGVMTRDRKLDCCIDSSHVNSEFDCDPDYAGQGGTTICSLEEPGARCKADIDTLCDLPTDLTDPEHPFVTDYGDWLTLVEGATATDGNARCRFWADNTGDTKTKGVVLERALNTFFSTTAGLDAARNTEDGRFLSEQLDQCAATPGACSTVLREQCERADFSREDMLAAANPAHPDHLKFRACACHLAPQKYSKFQGVITEGFFEACDPLCLLPSAVPPGFIDDETGEAKRVQCPETNCLIDGVTITLLNSELQDINFGQACGGCEPDADGGGGTGCSCTFEDFDIWAQASRLGNIDVAQNCTTCKVREPGSSRETEVDCAAGVPTQTLPPPPRVDVFAPFASFVDENPALAIGGAAAVVLYLFVLVFLATRPRKT